jgi:hypothetical protein
VDHRSVSSHLLRANSRKEVKYAFVLNKVIYF